MTDNSSNSGEGTPSRQAQERPVTKRVEPSTDGAREVVAVVLDDDAVVPPSTPIQQAKAPSYISRAATGMAAALRHSAMVREGVGVAAVLILAAIGFATFHSGTVSQAEAASKQGAHMAPPPPPVIVIQVKEQESRYFGTFPGVIAPYKPHEVRSEVAGRIVSRNFAAGDMVKKNQRLFTIETKPFRLSYRAARARVDRAEVSLAAARSALERARELAKIEAISKQDLEAIEAAAGEAKAVVDELKAAMRLAAYQTTKTKIRALSDGIISASLVQVGDMVSPQSPSPLAVIESKGRVYAQLQVPVREVARLKSLGMLQQKGSARDGSPVVLSVDGEGGSKQFNGSIDYVARQTNGRAGTVTVRAEIQDTSGELLAGMFIKGTLRQSEATTALFIPQSALVRGAGGSTKVWKVSGEDNVAAVDVVVGSELAGAVQILSGLSAGDRVVSQGLVKLHAGASKITPIAGKFSLRHESGTAIDIPVWLGATSASSSGKNAPASDEESTSAS